MSAECEFQPRNEQKFKNVTLFSKNVTQFSEILPGFWKMWPVLWKMWPGFPKCMVGFIIRYLEKWEKHFVLPLFGKWRIWRRVLTLKDNIQGVYRLLDNIRPLNLGDATNNLYTTGNHEYSRRTESTTGKKTSICK